MAVEYLGQFPSSSFSAWFAGAAPPWLQSTVVLEAAGCANQSDPWLRYFAHLVAIARQDSNDDRMVRSAFSRDWAIGTAAWRKALAREHAHLALAPELSQSEVKELQSERWEQALESALQESGRTSAEPASAPKSARWKRTFARKLRDEAAPPYRWLAEKLSMGKPGSVRASVHTARPGDVGPD